ncbi:helix-turn-helix transcriptional regulator [Oceanobacillus chungangensis]|uniref:Transcriptional regulator n=1 Tax=Oceanobacillus chungangensis TaxID=1229152 RepID=A0A3D8PIR4_9BACI|nr:helix-turn-helix transcriptional regulator [Oceanobacillus chungangensis]RDW15944.1 transcriptional regulator [Oceanobacillus chungangensis]
MFGVGKKRSNLGKWLDRNGYSQEDLVNASGVSRNTISKACTDPDYEPSTKVMKKILKAVRKIDPNISMDDFWDI